MRSVGSGSGLVPWKEDPNPVSSASFLSQVPVGMDSTPSSPPKLLTKYERARLVSARVGELEANSPVTVDTGADDTLFDIAMREVDARSLDIKLTRFLPGGMRETLHLSDFPIQD